MAFQEYLRAIDEIEERLQRLEVEIHTQAAEGEHAAVAQALETLRGVVEVTAVTVVADMGSFSRFTHPKQMIAYAGLVPSDYSNDGTRRQGRITKTSNAQTEAAWSYRYPPSGKGALRQRQEGQQPEVCRRVGKGQDRLYRLFPKGQHPNLTAVALARELLGLIRAITCHAGKQRTQTSQVAA